MIKYLKSDFCPLAIYLIIALILFPFLQYVVAQDQISYISIAHKYLNSNFDQAINGIWSPLISWLLVPLMLIEIYPPKAFKLIQILIGFFTLYSSAQLLKIFISNNLIQNICLVGLSIIILYFVYFSGTPDLLITFLLVLYMYFLMQNNFSINVSKAIIIGVIGGLAYYAKAYGFPFFILHFTFMSLVLIIIRKGTRSNIIKFYFITMSIFGTLSIVWAFLLFNKYNVLNYTLAAEYNFNFAGPKFQKVQTIRMETLYPPSNETAVSYWEDPSFLKVEGWSPFESWDSFMYQLNLIIINSKLALSSTFPIWAVTFIILFFLPEKRSLIKNKKLAFLLFTFSLYLSGFLLIMIEQRYLIFNFILLVIITAHLFNILNEKILWNRKVRLFILIILFSIFVARPLYSIVKNINSGKSIHKLSFDIKRDLDLKGNIASFSRNPLYEDWGNTTYIAYVNNLKFYGEVNRDLAAEELFRELRRFNIDYFFVWGNKKFNELYFKELAHYTVETSSLLNNNYLEKISIEILKLSSKKKNDTELKIYEIIINN